MACCWMWRKGMAIRWHHYHAMAFVAGISSGQRQLSPWARKGSLIRGDQMMQDRGNFQNISQRWYCHTFSTELVFADGLPSSSTGLVYSMHIFTNIPVRKLERVFLYFECFFIARSPHLPIVTGFCCFVKEEGKAQTMENVLIKLQSGLDSALKEHCFLCGQLSEATFKGYLIQCHSQRGVDTYVRWDSLWHYWAEFQKLLRMEILCLSEPCHVKLLLW